MCEKLTVYRNCLQVYEDEERSIATRDSNDGKQTNNLCIAPQQQKSSRRLHYPDGSDVNKSPTRKYTFLSLLVLFVVESTSTHMDLHLNNVLGKISGLRN